MVNINNIQNFTEDRPVTGSVFGTATTFDELPETHKAQILFLNKEASDFLYSYSSSAHIITGGIWNPFEKRNFKDVDTFDDFTGSERNEHALKKWMYKRAIPFSSWVFLLEDGNNQALLLTWKMVVKYAPQLFVMSDMIVFDATVNWCLVYFHEGKLFFGKHNVYNTDEDDKKMEALNEQKKKYPQFRHPYL